MTERDELQKEMAVLQAELGEMRERFAEVALGLRAATAGEGTAFSRESVEEQGQGMLDRLRSVFGEARAQGKRACDALETQLEERPLTCLVAAFGIGLLVGKLLDWRR